MARYRLSEAAAQDIENIFEFGIDAFGLVQALKYTNGLGEQLSRIAEKPELYPAVDYIRDGYRRSVYKSHAVYYRILEETVFIVRILGRQDIDAALQR